MSSVNPFGEKMEERRALKEQAKGFLTWSNVRDVSILGLVTVISIRLATADINVDLSGFNFTDLLSMFLAVSSVALSAAFYFKADESSRSFYNNSYQFTKDVSEILGRIEAGFGERLRHIDEGYTGLSHKFDKMPFDKSFSDVGENQKVAEIEEQEAKQQDIIEELMARAQLADEEKTSLLSKLASLSDEVSRSKNELTQVRASAGLFEEHNNFVQYLARIVREFYSEKYITAPPGAIRSRWRTLQEHTALDETDRSYLEKFDLVRKGQLTSAGVELVREAIRRAYS